MTRFIRRQSASSSATIVAVVAFLTVLGRAVVAGPPVKLNGPVAAGSKIIVDTGLGGFGPDGSRIFYRVQNASGVSDLYSVPSGGGGAAKLNVPNSFGIFGSPGAWQPYFVSPDGSHVFYTTGSNGTAGLYATPSAGGPSVNLTGPMTSDQILALTGVNSDGSRVTYYRGFGNGQRAIYSVSITGGAPTLLKQSDSGLPATMSPDGEHIFYRTGQSIGGQYLETMYRVPIEGGSAAELFGPVALNSSFAFSPDGSRLTYLAGPTHDGVFEYYSVPANGGPSVQLSNWGNSTQNSPFWAKFNADGSRIVYLADQETPGRYELYSVPSIGGPWVKLNGPEIPRLEPELSPDGAYVLYASQDGANQWELHIVPTVGGTPLKLDGPTSGPTINWKPAFTRDGARVIYQTKRDTDSFEIFSVPSNGGPPVKLNGPLVAGGNAIAPIINADGSRAIYVANQESKDYYGLYIVPTGGGTPVKLSADLQLQIRTGSLSPDGSRVLFETQNRFNSGPNDIYSRVLSERWNGGGGDWDAASNWNLGELPDEAMQVAIEGSANVVASGGAASRAVNELRLGGGSETSVLMLQSDAAITAVNGVVIESNGVLSGNGSVIGNVANAGSLSPGSSPGTLSIDGSFSQTAEGALLIDIAGLASVDLLQISGTAMLGGHLQVLLDDEASLTFGERFQILTASGGVSGRFASLQLPRLPGGLHLNVVYGTDDVALVVNTVPEPSGLTVVSAATTALLLSGWARRPRTRWQLYTDRKRG